MKEDYGEQAQIVAWVNNEERIITFHETEGFEKLIFQTQEDKMSYVYNRCESGYRIL